jgi:hypothetical protein
VADFTGEDLRGSRFERVDLSGSEFCSSDLTEIRIRAVEMMRGAVERLWGETVVQARRLDPKLLHESVDGEWSFTETLRHLVFATDAWIRSDHGGPGQDPTSEVLT